MHLFEKIAERKIQEAMERGDFDNLPLKGQPLDLDELSGVPEHLKMGFKILKNAGMVPEELLLKKELVSLRDLLDRCAEGEEKREVRKKLHEKQLLYTLLMERNLRK